MASTGYLLSFSEVLEAQLDDSLPYPTLKRLLRTLKTYHPAYPTSQNHASWQVYALSQTQRTQSKPDAHQESQRKQQDNNDKCASQSPREDESNFVTGIERSSIPELNDSLPVREPNENGRQNEDLQTVPAVKVQFLDLPREANEQIVRNRAENHLEENPRIPLKEITTLSEDNIKKRPYSRTSEGEDRNNFV